MKKLLLIAALGGMTMALAAAPTWAGGHHWRAYRGGAYGGQSGPCYCYQGAYRGAVVWRGAPGARYAYVPGRSYSYLPDEAMEIVEGSPVMVEAGPVGGPVGGGDTRTGISLTPPPLLVGPGTAQTEVVNRSFGIRSAVAKTLGNYR